MAEQDHDRALGRVALRILAAATIIELLEQANGLLPLFAGMTEQQAERRLVELYGDRP